MAKQGATQKPLNLGTSNTGCCCVWLHRRAAEQVWSASRQLWKTQCMQWRLESYCKHPYRIRCKPLKSHFLAAQEILRNTFNEINKIIFVEITLSCLISKKSDQEQISKQPCTYKCYQYFIFALNPPQKG